MTEQRTSTPDIKHRQEQYADLNARRVINGVETLVHNTAFVSLGYARNAIHRWIRERMNALMKDGDFIELRLNPWNETDGLGLQSVTIGIRRPAGGDKNITTEVLFPNEWKSPTIGIIEPAMIEKGETVVSRFQVDGGKGEQITALSSTLQMDGGKGVSPIYPMQEGEQLLVTGPGSVRTYLKVKDVVRPSDIRDVISRGVYACQFVNMPSENAPSAH